MPHDPDQPPATTRRRVLAGGAVAAGGVVVPAVLARSALAQSAPSTTDPVSTPSTSSPSAGGSISATTTVVEGGTPPTSAADRPAGDEQVTTTTRPPQSIAESPQDRAVAARARSLGHAGLRVYDAILDGVELSDATLAVAVRLFRTQHLESANAWSGAAGLPGDNTPNEALMAQLRSLTIGVRDEAGTLQALLQVEQTMAANMLALVGQFTAAAPAAMAAGLANSAARRAAVYGHALGLDLDDFIPQFQTTDGAVEPQEQP